MQQRTVRLTLLLILLIVSLSSASLLWYVERQSTAARGRAQHAVSEIDAMLASLTELGLAQHAAVAPGQAPESWLQQAARLERMLNTRADALGGELRTAPAVAALQDFRRDLTHLTQVAARAGEYLSAAETFMAADLVLTEGHMTLSSAAERLRTARTAEQAAEGANVVRVRVQQAAIAGGTALLWLVGLALLVRLPSASAARAQGTRESAANDRQAADAIAAAAPAAAPVVGAPVDLTRASVVCAELARVSDAATLPTVLGKAAGVLDATGAIVWLGAGEQLFAVCAHGYDPRVLSRLGPISRSASNATAEAWRDATVHTVPGEAGANGAIVVPMTAHEGCRGVLAFEVPAGRDQDDDRRAVAAMFGSQLAGMLAAWPAASGSNTAERAS